NSRNALASIIATTVGAGVAAGIAAIIGGHAGAAWVLRVGAALYLIAMVPGFRLPSGVDEPAVAADAEPGGSPNEEARPDAAKGAAAAAAGRRAAGGVRGRLLGRKLFPRPVGPVVGEALGANITLRAYSGFMIFFLAFILRTVHFGGVSDHLALGEMITGVAIGGFLGTAIGASMKSRAPQVILFGMLAATLIVTSLCAVYFGLWAAVIVAFAAALGQTLVKLALDSIVQREVSPDVRSSTFAATETLHQLSWVIGGLLGLLLSMTGSGVAGLSVAATGLAVSLGALIFARRNRILRARQEPVPRTS